MVDTNIITSVSNNLTDSEQDDMPFSPPAFLEFFANEAGLHHANPLCYRAVSNAEG